MIAIFSYPARAADTFICNDGTGKAVACTVDQSNYWAAYNDGVRAQCAAITATDEMTQSFLRGRCLAQELHITTVPFHVRPEDVASKDALTNDFTSK